MRGQLAPASGRQSWWIVASQRWSPYLDPVLGAGCAAAALASLLNNDPASIDPQLESPDVLSVVATAAAAGALAWRRRRPLTSYAVMVIGSLVVSLSGHYIGLLSVLLLFSLYSLAAHGRRPEGLAGLGVGVACFVGLALLDVPDLGMSDLLQAVALLVAAWAVGDAIRSRRRQQRDQVQAAITEERLRIARELHDVVAHSMSLIAVQAGVGAHLIRVDADAAERSLEVIADTSRRALEQTRSMLGMLRSENEDGTRPPTRGIDDLAELVADLRGAGLDVTLTLPSTAPELDAAISLTAYRIVQESLTNIVKHSAATTATVTVTLVGASIGLEVVDPGPARSSGTGSGHGLIGLEERARLVGGRVEYGVHGNGFRVHATLPVGVRR
ncbi:histidine kinase [Kribbella jejuensis]|uniref:histidine kinase n=1 Tax=Kribbella jejuensis TaxID=236068 RepID=A0A542ENZ3_9ACTN|nr:histidine kinase [Kribbella jejuensis]TQJ17039.1 signal transduction histidine kinase [Kribbella jejuensis]